MEKHIQYLLNTNLRIILPDFGAFIIRQKEPLIIVFNELLRYNDGLLIDYLARQENIEKDMAKHQVTEYTENLVKTLESAKEVILEGIGTLRRTGEDKIEFIQAGKDIARRTPRKVPEKKPVSAPADKTVIFEIDTEKTMAAAKTAGEIRAGTGRKPAEKTPKGSAPLKTSKSTEKKIPVPEKKVSENKDLKEETSNEQTVQPVREVKVKTAEAHVPVQPATKASIAVPPVRKVPESAKKRQRIIWIVLVVVALALINIWMIFHGQIRNFLGGTPVADTLGLLVETDTMTEQAVATDSQYAPRELPDDNISPEEEPISGTPLTEKENQPLAGEKRYYIVAGCFGEETNADAMVKTLAKKGYKAQKYGKRGNLFCVSYSSFTNRDEAIAALEKIREEEDPEAWLNEY